MTRIALLCIVGLALGGCKGKQKARKINDAGATDVIAVGSGSTRPSGGAATEVEPNDGADTATPLATGATVAARMESDADVDYFRIDVAQAGALAISVNDVAADLILEIEDGSGTLVARSDRGGARSREGIPNLGVTPGRYTAVVKSKKPAAVKPKKGKKAPPAPPAEPIAYEIAANVQPFAKGFEREPDDDRGTANDLIPGETAQAFVGWAGDVDVWKLSIEALSVKNVLDLEIDAVEGLALTVELADGVGNPLLARKGTKNARLVVRGLVLAVPPGAPPFHYVTIKGDRSGASNHETPYKLRAVAQVPGVDAEAEPNDAPDRAMAFPADRTVVNAGWSPGDIDCFVVAPEDAARTLEVTIDTPGDADLSVEILLDGKSLAKADQPVKGAAEKVTAPIPAGARPIIKVKGADGGAEGTYEVKLADLPAK